MEHPFQKRARELFMQFYQQLAAIHSTHYSIQLLFNTTKTIALDDIVFGKHVVDNYAHKLLEYYELKHGVVKSDEIREELLQHAKESEKKEYQKYLNEERELIRRYFVISLISLSWSKFEELQKKILLLLKETYGNRKYLDEFLHADSVKTSEILFTSSHRFFHFLKCLHEYDSQITLDKDTLMRLRKINRVRNSVMYQVTGDDYLIKIMNNYLKKTYFADNGTIYATAISFKDALDSLHDVAKVLHEEMELIEVKQKNSTIVS